MWQVRKSDRPFRGTAFLPLRRKLVTIKAVTRPAIPPVATLALTGRDLVKAVLLLLLADPVVALGVDANARNDVLNWKPAREAWTPHQPTVPPQVQAMSGLASTTQLHV